MIERKQFFVTNQLDILPASSFEKVNGVSFEQWLVLATMVPYLIALKRYFVVRTYIRDLVRGCMRTLPRGAAKEEAAVTGLLTAGCDKRLPRTRGE